MFKYSNSFQTHRICCKQYLDSIWIVFVCRGCWRVGWGCQHRPDGPTTDPSGNFRSPQTWLYRDMRLPQLGSVVLWLRVFTQLWNWQDMFRTIWRLDLNSIWEYGGRVGGTTLWGHIKTYHWGCQICQGYDEFSSLIFMFRYSNGSNGRHLVLLNFLQNYFSTFVLGHTSAIYMQNFSSICYEMNILRFIEIFCGAGI